MSHAVRVLVVDDDRRMAETICDILRVSDFDADGVHSGQAALEKLATGSYSCVLTDIKMPGIGGVDLFRTIKETRPDLPVVLMTAYATDELVRQGLKEGAIAALSKPLDMDSLLAFFSSLREERTITIVDDDRKFSKTLGDILRERGMHVREINNPYEVLGALESDCQTVLLDMKLNGISGLDVLRNIRSQCPTLPVVLVTGYKQEMADVIKGALALSAHVCLYKPLEMDVLFEVLANVHKREMNAILTGTTGR